MTNLRLFNSLTRQVEDFTPVHPGEARVYTCGPTVYNYPHIGNMRAYVFADILGRTLSWKGYALTHVINITDVGHLTDDADSGEDKMEKMAAERAQSIWDIARHYTEAYWADVKALNIRQPAKWSVATDYIEEMLEFAKSIADKHCYELESGLYFDVSSVEDYGRLALVDLRAKLGSCLEVAENAYKAAKSCVKSVRKIKSFVSPSAIEMIEASETALPSVVNAFEDTKRAVQRGNLPLAQKCAAASASAAAAVSLSAVILERVGPEVTVNLSKAAMTFGRIETVEGKRNAADFAIWRKTPAGETRQMEWDSPWGKGAPGWHLECSVMSGKLLGFPFDIHTGGIDHREIHHPNEIAQNQAFCGCGGLGEAANSGARIWMHNNFLVERSGKMSKSSGEFLRLQLLIDKGYHPLAYRMMCLQAHYRSELEFSWEGLEAALVRLKRLVMGITALRSRHAELGSASISEEAQVVESREWTLKQVQGDEFDMWASYCTAFDEALSDDLATPRALTVLEETLARKKARPEEKLRMIAAMDSVLGLDLLNLTREDLRIRPKGAEITEAEIEDTLARRKTARAAKDFATSDALRDELATKGVEVMDGDPLGWEWKLG